MSTDHGSHLATCDLDVRAGCRSAAQMNWLPTGARSNSHYPEGAPLQAFTGTGRVTDDEPCQVEMTPDFHPFRRNVAFDECVEAPIRPLLDALTFIEDKKRWGYRFRFGLFQIGEHDFDAIRTAMTPPRQG